MIKQALDAMDKAAPGPWQWIEYGDDLEGSYMADRDREDLYAGGYARREATEMVAIAAPDMAAWIKKALPYMMFARACVGAGLISTNKAYDEKELDALIKEATE
jgi:hypothetical protein